MDLHSIALRSETHTHGNLPSQSNLNDRHRLEMLHVLLDSAKSFLDTLLEWPVAEYNLIPFVEWMRLPRVVINLCKLSFPGKTHIPEWDVKVARDRVRLDLYLESLCFRMQTLTNFKPPHQKVMDFWFAMQKIMEHIRKWYMRETQSSALPPSKSSKPQDTSPCGSGRFTFSTPAQVIPSSNIQVDDNRTPYHIDPGQNYLRASPPSAGNFFSTHFDIDQFMDMEFWGGAGSYDPTIFDSI